jgi:antirestriction protein ArdC
MPNPPEIVHGGDKAFYSPMTDLITMPPRGLFENADEYWSTFWHEAAHYADFRIMPRFLSCPLKT